MAGPLATPIPSTALPERTREALRALARSCGVKNIRIFGSFARGEATVESDVDLLVDYEPGQSGFAFVRFCEGAEKILGRPVDVATERSLHRLIRDRVVAETVAL